MTIEVRWKVLQGLIMVKMMREGVAMQWFLCTKMNMVNKQQTMGEHLLLLFPGAKSSK